MEFLPICLFIFLALTLVKKCDGKKKIISLELKVDGEVVVTLRARWLIMAFLRANVNKRNILAIHLHTALSRLHKSYDFVNEILRRKN